MGIIARVMENLYRVLERHFGYKNFRPLQEEIISEVLAGKDVFALMPTGGGKSLCFQIPSLLLPGVTIVISPLIALMKDQVDALIKNGVNAALLNSSLSSLQKEEIKKKLLNKQIPILYVAPERAVTPEFIEILKRVEVSLFAIDEAHCISQWGHDFRPEYRQLSTLRNQFPRVPIIALTATATEQVKQDIVSQLSIHNAVTYQASFNRPNLIYKVLNKQNGTDQIVEYLNKPEHRKESGIIYCQTRDTVDEITKELQKLGFRALAYHAGLSDEERVHNQEQFIKENVEIMVATIAFGMGIDKPNVRFVIHLDIPSSLERYYQETGRAGRDGLLSECLLLFSMADIFKVKHFINRKPDLTERRVAFDKLQLMINFGQSAVCRRVSLLNYFGENYEDENCGACDNCLDPKETFDATEVVQKILSCIARTNQRFGPSYISNVLLGQNEERIIQNKHDHLSTFGIISEYTDTQIKNLISQLIEQGIVDKSSDQYSILTLNQTSSSVLKGDKQVKLHAPPTKQSKKKVKKKTEISSFDKNLFEKLRVIRKSLADKENLPPYIIFSDASLQQMAHFYPTNSEQFSKISGVGEMKLKQYGEIFVSIIKDYCQMNNIAYEGLSA